MKVIVLDDVSAPLARGNRKAQIRGNNATSHNMLGNRERLEGRELIVQVTSDKRGGFGEEVIADVYPDLKPLGEDGNFAGQADFLDESTGLYYEVKTKYFHKGRYYDVWINKDIIENKKRVDRVIPVIITEEPPKKAIVLGYSDIDYVLNCPLTKESQHKEKWMRGYSDIAYKVPVPSFKPLPLDHKAGRVAYLDVWGCVYRNQLLEL